MIFTEKYLPKGTFLKAQSRCRERQALLTELARYHSRLKAVKLSRRAVQHGALVFSHMTKFSRIVVDSAIRFGKSCVRGKRITVGQVLGFLAGGGEEELIEDFPQLTYDDVLDWLGFAAERERCLLAVPAA